jgi:dipeptidyl aminopeptidase/acylaminoacyl peptidase
MICATRSLLLLGWIAVVCGGVAAGQDAVTNADNGAITAADPAGAVVAVAKNVTDTAAVASQPLATWLLLGPATIPLPAFHDAKEKGFAVDDLLQNGSLDARALKPRLDDAVRLPQHPDLIWREVAAEGGVFTLAAAPPPEGPVEPKKPIMPAAPAEAYLAVYLKADRWQEASLKLTADHPVQAFLDGRSVSLNKPNAEKTAQADRPAGDEGNPAVPESAPAAAVSYQGKLQLPLGKHLLLIHTVYDPEKDEPWRLAASLSRPPDTPAAALVTTLDPARAVTIHDILEAPQIRAAVLSPDGGLVAVSLREYDADGQEDRWLEVRRTADGSLQRSWRGRTKFEQVRWAPSGHKLSYVTSTEDESSIWLYDLRDGSTTALAEDIADLDGYSWAPDGTFLVYAVTDKAKPDERKVKRLRGLEDRQPRWRDRNYLVQVAVPAGGRRRLTAGPLSPEGWSISPDSRRLLFFHREEDMSARPYSRTQLWQLDLGTLQAHKLLEDRWIQAAAYGPEPNRIALQGSPSAFDGLGSVLPEGVPPNDYGGQLFLYDTASGKAEAVSRDFDPAIGSVVWSRRDGRIYADCVDGQYSRLYAYDPRRKEWSIVPTGIEVVAAFDLAMQVDTAVAYGTSATTPPRLAVVDLAKNRSRPLRDPGAEHYRDIEFGKVEPWVCTLKNGERLDGFVYYPPDFDPERKYPCIVYYYGGTFPVTRDFGGRYPKNVWAGEGYVIYVPEPSGAVGYGQEFAARHVNDWGKITAGEVIEGAQAFLAAHPFTDPERVGCIGASYGGFLTMYLVTQTDMFAAAISHAGISAITSYWGEGLWGYAYGARALAHSFPWSDRDLFIEQSPLYLADKIHTPLLLLHGADDTNVPVGESDQLYTALKLLGRDVEYVQVEGQDHWILDRDRRIVWNDTILAYFAKMLKHQPQWWDNLYPETKQE